MIKTVEELIARLQEFPPKMKIIHVLGDNKLVKGFFTTGTLEVVPVGDFDLIVKRAEKDDPSDQLETVLFLG